jgi:hypothetical protein
MALASHSNRFANFQALSAATAQQENLPRVANRCATEFSRRPVHWARRVTYPMAMTNRDELGDAAQSWEEYERDSAALVNEYWPMIEAVAARLMKLDWIVVPKWTISAAELRVSSISKSYVTEMTASNP